MKFEYKILKKETISGMNMGGKVDENAIESQLNLLGKDGWEVVSAMDTNMAYGQSRDVIIILKRTIE